MLVSPIKMVLLSTIRAFIFLFADYFEEGAKVLSMVLGSRAVKSISEDWLSKSPVMDYNLIDTAIYTRHAQVYSQIRRSTSSGQSRFESLTRCASRFRDDVASGGGKVSYVYSDLFVLLCP